MLTGRVREYGAMSLDQSRHEENRVQAVNVKRVLFGIKHAIPHLRAAGGADRVLQIGSHHDGVHFFPARSAR